MKICFLCDSYKPVYDGVTRYFDYVIPALVKAGHEVNLVCPKFENTPYIEHPFPGFTVSRCFNPGFNEEGYWFALPDQRMFKAIKEADFVITHSPATIGVLGAILAKMMSKKVGIFIHQDERVILRNVLHTPRFWYNVTIITLSQIFYAGIIDVFFCATERFKAKLLDLGVPEERIFRTTFAINKEKFHPGKPKFDIRKRHGIPKDAIVSIYVGRLAKEKNIKNLLKGTDKAMDEAKNLYALFVGDGPDWENYSSFPFKNKERMIFTGFVPEEELHSHYVAADFFTSPSLNESSCFTVFEAMSCQLAVITSAFRHDKDIIHKKNVILVENINDPEEIKEAILLLTNNPKLRDEISRQGKELIDNRNWDNHVKALLRGVNYALTSRKKKKLLRTILKPKYRYLQKNIKKK